MLPSSHCRQSRSFILVICFCSSLRRQAPPGCREGLPTSAGDAVLSRGATKTGRRNRPPHLCCGHRASSDHPVDRLLLPGLALETTETASNAGLDAAACDVRRRCSVHSGSTIAPQLMQRHPPYSWSPDPSPPRSSNFSRTINPPHRAHLIACLLP